MGTSKALAALILFGFSSVAFATDFTAPLQQPDGSAYVDTTGKPVEFNLEIVARNVLLNDVPSEAATPDEKGKAFALWIRIAADPKNVTLTSDDVAVLKNRTGKFYNPWVYGNMLRLISPNDVPK